MGASLLDMDYIAIHLPDLYKHDRDLVSMARSGELDPFRERMEMKSNPNSIVPEKLGFLCEARSRFYFIEEKTPLIAAVEEGHQDMFDLLLSYQHLLDVNAVCCEWSLSAAYKFYTALDVGRVCARARKTKKEKQMVERLLSRGGKSAEELPAPFERENPFLRWKEHFPDGNLDNIGTEFATGSTGSAAPTGPNYGPSAPPRSPREAGPRKGRSTAVDVPSGQGWQFPPEVSLDEEVLKAVSSLKHQLQSSEVSSSEEKQRLLRPLFLTWHPDKRPEQVELATQVFQWLQAIK
ncbi:Aspartate-semialdehyde dehydrogenase [Durusdinium trenchii]|uniref:Aspartate-semialdehyde dehydrogenase n=1 Tax=Durusdinium trenchii TaxID=1381693 RepID=A0ABP0QMY0_9DINO